MCVCVEEILMIGVRGAGGNEVHEALPAAASAGDPPQAIRQEVVPLENQHHCPVLDPPLHGTNKTAEAFVFS